MKVTKNISAFIAITGFAVSGIAQADHIISRNAGDAVINVITAPIPRVEHEVIYVGDPYYYHTPHYRHDNGLHLGQQKHKHHKRKHKHD